jgi:hypothetical protein
MKDTEKVRYIHDIETGPTPLAARKPFKVEMQDSRRFVRIEISSPMSLSKIKDAGGNFEPDGDWHTLHGLILNISAGGVLVEVDQPLLEGDVVSMHFTLQEIESIDNVLGLVKRADEDEGAFLAGIQFITREYLRDIFSQAEMDLLPDRLTNFNESIRDVLNKYIFLERIAAAAE